MPRQDHQVSVHAPRPSPRPRDAPTRRYAFACDSCKRRKIKCDGELPVCHGCQKYKEQCIYMNRDGTRRWSPSGPVHITPGRVETAANTTPPHQSYARDPNRQPQLTIETLRIPEPSPPGRGGLPTPRHISFTQVSSDDEPAGDLALDNQVTIDTAGELQHHGSTSLLYTSGRNRVSWTTPTYENELSERDALRANARLAHLHEVMAMKDIEATGPDLITAYHLLQTYWTWQHPQHQAIFRPAFMRDLGQGGPYCSPFLLNVVYAHAARIAYPRDRPLSDKCQMTESDFLSRAKMLLMLELDKRPTIPTIQGLIILGGRECACGNTSGGWLYTGIALRMMKDRGFHLDSELLRSEGTISAEEKEIRRNLWWSAYTWDKHISLTLGRGPTWRSYGGRFPGFLLDDSTRDNLWEPYHITSSNELMPTAYPPTKGHVTLTFNWLCRLNVIIDSILVKLYIGCIPTSQRAAALTDIEQRLTEWWINLPDVIRLDVSCLPEVCPPPHILSLNMLYRSAQILLHRQSLTSRLESDNSPLHPMQQDNRSRAKCRSAAEEIHELCLLHGKTFEYRNLLYIVSYCVFLAASVNAVEIYSRSTERRQSAAARLTLNIHVLEHGANRAPGITKSIETIKRRLADSVVPSRATSPRPTSPLASGQFCTDALTQATTAASNDETLLAGLSPGYQDWFNGCLPAFPEQDSWFAFEQFAGLSGGAASMPPMVTTGFDDIFGFPSERE